MIGKLIILTAILIMPGCLYARAFVQAFATVDSASVYIGNKVVFTQKLVSDKKIDVVFPQIPLTIDSPEILSVGPVDTFSSGNEYVLTRKIEAICFSPGRRIFPPTAFPYADEELKDYSIVHSDSVIVEFRLYETDSGVIRGIKVPPEAKSNNHIFLYLAAGLALVVALAPIRLIMLRRRTKTLTAKEARDYVREFEACKNEFRKSAISPEQFASIIDDLFRDIYREKSGTDDYRETFAQSDHAKRFFETTEKVKFGGYKLSKSEIDEHLRFVEDAFLVLTNKRGGG